MKISSGRMDRRVRLLQPAPAVDAFGGPTVAFADVGTRWCARLAFQPTEAERDSQRETFAGIRLQLRDLGLVQQMDTTWRVLFEGDELEIIGLDREPADASVVITGRKSTSPAFAPLVVPASAFHAHAATSPEVVDVDLEPPPPPDPEPEPPAPGEFPSAASFTATSVADFEITFTFGATATVGAFAVHGHWMDNSAAANVTAISPAAVQEVRETVGGPDTDLSWWNGASRGMSTAAQIAAAPDSSAARQGFTSWVGAVASGAVNVYHIEYQDAFNIDPGRTGNPITGFGPVVKGIQEEPVPSGQRSTSSARESARWYSGLWMLNGTPPTAAPDHYFMPPPQVEAPRWIIARNGSGSVLDISMFPALAIPVTGRPVYADVLARARHFVPATHFNSGAGRNLYSAIQGPKFYGREHSRLMSDALILLCSDTITSDQKVRLAEGLVQQGIFWAGLISNGAIQGAFGMGNTSSGKKLPLVIAAVTTGNTWLQDHLAASNADGRFFAEDIQMRFIASGDVSAWSAWGGIQSYAGLTGRGEWRLDNGALNPSWIQSEYGANHYRHNWCVSQVGIWAGCRLAPALKTAWGGATAYDDYFERYMLIEEARGWVGEGTTDSLGGGGSYLREFYLAHRSAIDAG